MTTRNESTPDDGAAAGGVIGPRRLYSYNEIVQRVNALGGCKLRDPRRALATAREGLVVNTERYGTYYYAPTLIERTHWYNLTGPDAIITTNDGVFVMAIPLTLVGYTEEGVRRAVELLTTAPIRKGRNTNATKGRPGERRDWLALDGE